MLTSHNTTHTHSHTSNREVTHISPTCSTHTLGHTHCSPHTVGRHTDLNTRRSKARRSEATHFFTILKRWMSSQMVFRYRCFGCLESKCFTLLLNCSSPSNWRQKEKQIRHHSNPPSLLSKQSPDWPYLTRVGYHRLRHLDICSCYTETVHVMFPFTHCVFLPVSFPGCNRVHQVSGTCLSQLCNSSLRRLGFLGLRGP